MESVTVWKKKKKIEKPVHKVWNIIALRFQCTSITTVMNPVKSLLASQFALQLWIKIVQQTIWQRNMREKSCFCFIFEHKFIILKLISLEACGWIFWYYHFDVFIIIWGNMFSSIMLHKYVSNIMITEVY